jgi:hypothetical protein
VNRAAAFVALVGVTLAGIGPLPARAATSETTTTTAAPAAASTAPGVSLVSQPAWIATRGVEVLDLHLDEPALADARDAAVEITVHRSVTSRTEFDNAIDKNDLPSTRTRLTFPLSSLGINKRGDFLLGFGLSGSGAPRSVEVDNAGVYPVEVRIVDAGGDRTTFTTWMVVVDPANNGIVPLRFAWIWRLVAPPLQLVGEPVNKTVRADIRRGGRLDHISKLLERAHTFPLTLGIGPETLASWSSQARLDNTLAAGAKRVKRAAARATTELLPEPYVPIDGPTIEAEKLGSQLPAEYVAGSTAIETLTGQIPDPRTAFVDPVDDATVGRLTQMLIGRYVVRDAALTPVVEPLTPAQPFTLTTPSTAASPAVATDSGLERLVDSAGPPALRAQRVVAALAEIAYEAPAQPRGVVLSTPSDWKPDVGTITLLLQQLAHDPLVQPATLDDVFADVPSEERDGTPLQRELAPITASGTQPLFASEYDDAARSLDAYETMVGSKDPSVAAGQRALLLSLSTANTRAQALAQLQTITDNLHAVTNGITATAKTLTLTARRAELPLSFQNDTKRAGLHVRVHLESPKLIFPDGPDIDLVLPIGHYTKRVAVEARASGTFSMTVTLESADGSLALGPPTRVTIRSAVFSGIGIALTIGALLFLAGWWGNHFRRTRRDRRRAAAS